MGIAEAITVASFVFGVVAWLFARLSGVSTRLERLEAKMEIIWRDLTFAATVAAAKTLHQEDNRYQLDELIDAFIGESISDDQLLEFEQRLNNLRSNASTAIERIAAAILLDRVQDRFSF